MELIVVAFRRWSLIGDGIGAQRVTSRLCLVTIGKVCVLLQFHGALNAFGLTCWSKLGVLGTSSGAAKRRVPLSTHSPHKVCLLTVWEAVSDDQCFVCI